MAEKCDLCLWNQGSGGGGGSSGGVMVLHEAFNEQLGYFALDKTAGEIEAAIKSGAIVFIVNDIEEDGKEDYVTQQITTMQKDETAEFVYTFIAALTIYDSDAGMWVIEPYLYQAETANDYPFGN